MTETWLHRDASVNVDVHSVADFARKVQAEINENFLPSITEGVAPMMSVPAPFGAGAGLGEAALFRDMHERNRQAVMQLLNDVARCLTALSNAAAAVAAEYAAGDVESAATTSDVYDAFTPTSAYTATGGTTPATTTGPAATTGPGGPYAAPEPGGQQASAGSDPDNYSPPANPDAAVVVAPGTAGEYTIPADDEGMRSCAPPIPQPND